MGFSNPFNNTPSQKLSQYFLSDELSNNASHALFSNNKLNFSLVFFFTFPSFGVLISLTSRMTIGSKSPIVSQTIKLFS